MDAKELRRMLRASPFTPVVVNISDSRSMIVRHPETAWMTEGGATLIVGLGGNEWELVSVPQITGVSVTGAAARQSAV